jgi:TorA maturation chaperone TorD
MVDFLDDLAEFLGGEAVADLKRFAAIAQVEQDVASLKQEYMGLFAVPTGSYVTPFEDVYRGGGVVDGKLQRGPLLGERAIAVRRLYQQAGAEMDRACKELPTHIGVEISFMGFLCEREAAAIRHADGQARLEQSTAKVANSVRYRELQRRFLQEHLNAWFPQLSQAIQANAKSHFYRGLARITEAFLARDHQSFSTIC